MHTRTRSFRRTTDSRLCAFFLASFLAGSITAAPDVKWSKTPLSFEPSAKQTKGDEHYLARGRAFTLYLSKSEMVVMPSRARDGRVPALRTKPLGANASVRIAAEQQQQSTSNYFLGNDPSKWRTGVPNYGQVRYSSVYPGIDLVYYGNEGTIEYDWVVAPGSDPSKIRLAFEGADALRIDEQGDLVLKVGSDELRHKKPVVYQDSGGKRVEVAGAWTLHGKEGSFRIGAYDRSKPLVIDPSLVAYSTYLGGSNNDYAYAIAVDSIGNVYVTGGTGSTNFPVQAQFPYQGTLKGSGDAFVTKYNAVGTKMYSTYLGGATGGSGTDEGRGIAVNSQGEAYITGNAGTSDFPTLGALQPTWGGSGDAFITKLSSNGGSLMFSTYLGGSSVDVGMAIALDPSDNAYVTGITYSTDFPLTSAYQGTKGTFQDAFVAKITGTGSAWIYRTYLGGNNVDEGYAIAVDANGNAYVTGETYSTNFPTQSPYRPSLSGPVDAFVTKLNPAGSALGYSTYLGGSNTDYGTGIAVDASGNAYVTGVTGNAVSNDFPLVSPMQPTFGGGDDAFITKFNAAGSSPIYSTYLGGGSVDDPYAIAIDRLGDVWVTGRTNSSDFPLTNQIQATRTAFDMFITELNPAGSAKLFSTFYGGSGSESGRGIVVDLQGNIHIAGETTSTDFPVTNPAQATNGGAQDALVLGYGANAPLVAASAVFRDSAGLGSYRLSTYAFRTLINGGGVFQSDPAAAEDGSGNVFVAGRDSFRSMWVNRYNPLTQTWGSWAFGGGIFRGNPAIAVAPNGTAWIVGQDNSTSYWIASYSTGGGWSAWTPLYGIFGTDPQITACPDGSLYMVGKDNYNSLYSGRYIPGTGFQGWQFGGGIVYGDPSITCGSDNAVYIAVRDFYQSHWVARVAGNTWTGWFFGGALTNSYPKVAALGGSIAIVIRDPTNVVWRNTFTEGAGNGWGTWTQVGGVLSDHAPAAYNGELYFVGQAPNGDLWWWRQTGNTWTWISNNGVAQSPLSAAPR